jgi:hypothetical protein
MHEIVHVALVFRNPLDPFGFLEKPLDDGLFSRADRACHIDVVSRGFDIEPDPKGADTPILTDDFELLRRFLDMADIATPLEIFRFQLFHISSFAPPNSIKTGDRVNLSATLYCVDVSWNIRSVNPGKQLKEKKGSCE